MDDKKHIYTFRVYSRNIKMVSYPDMQRGLTYHFVNIVTVIVLVSIMAAYIMMGDISRIKNVNFEGKFANLEEQELHKAVSPFTGDAFFKIKINEIKQTIAGLPWVDSVRVRRTWPDTLDVLVIEKTAIARWGDKSLLSDKGLIFTPDNILMFSNLPKMHGNDPENLLSIYREFNRVLSIYGVSVITIDQDDRGDIKALIGNVLVRFGRDNLNQRLIRLADVLANLDALELNIISIIDLRYTNGVAVTLQTTSSENTRAEESMS